MCLVKRSVWCSEKVEAAGRSRDMWTQSRCCQEDSTFPMLRVSAVFRGQRDSCTDEEPLNQKTPRCWNSREICADEIPQVQTARRLHIELRMQARFIPSRVSGTKALTNRFNSFTRPAQRSCCFDLVSPLQRRKGKRTRKSLVLSRYQSVFHSSRILVTIRSAVKIRRVTQELSTA